MKLYQSKAYFSGLFIFGNNNNGQRNANNWRDVIAITAGEFHTVGLKKDGTVIAVGDNSGGQIYLYEYTTREKNTWLGLSSKMIMRKQPWKLI